MKIAERIFDADIVLEMYRYLEQFHSILEQMGSPKAEAIDSLRRNFAKRFIREKILKGEYVP